MLENLQHFMGPGLYNLADAYTNMMLLDSVVANKHFIRLFGLDRILNEGEIKAVTQESAGTADFKHYRQTSYEKMKTIPVNMFDLTVTENAIIAYMQSHATNYDGFPALNTIGSTGIFGDRPQCAGSWYSRDNGFWCVPLRGSPVDGLP